MIDRETNLRLADLGERALSDAELVSVALGVDMTAAGALVARVGGAAGIARAGLAEIRGPGVGAGRARALRAAVEIGRRAHAPGPPRGASMRDPSDVAALLGDMAALEQEEMHVLALDARHRLITRFVAARGALNTVHVAPCDVMRPLVREGAAGAIVAHNHPSGDCSPSPEDADLTRRLQAAGNLVGIPLLDHLIIARDGYHSFSDDLGGHGEQRQAEGRSRRDREAR